MNHVDNPFINPSVLSYCPGILGLERGLKRAIGSIRTAAYVEIEAFICENLLVGMGAGLVDAAPIWLNLKTFPAEQFRGAVDGIIGGYPCQPFSNAGERRGAEDPRHLYPYIEQHIRTIKPVWCFFENVSGHLSLGFREVRESLSNLGYNVEAGIFTAEEVGAPHQRERLFILAIRKDYLGYPNSDGYQTRNRLGRTEIETGRGEGQDGERQWLRLEPSPAGAHGVGNPQSSNERRHRIRERELQQQVGRSGNDTVTVGLANCDRAGCEEQRQPIPAGSQYSTAQYLRKDHWPSRPGEEQFDWEAPRVESRLGFNVNGYSFREDLLRALGNSVVEQTAEIAFINLYNKHFNAK